MSKFLSKKNLLITSVASVILIGSFALKASARHHMSEDGPVTLDAMLEKAGKYFDKIDSDGNAIITQAEADEAKKTRQQKMAARMTEKLTSMFERLDRDGDGLIREGDKGYVGLSDRLDLEGDLTLDQIQTAAAEKRHEGRANHELETGENALTFPLTRADALATAEKRFTAADIDGDGVLSESEKPNHRPHKSKGPGSRHKHSEN